MQRGFFQPTQSKLMVGNDGYLCICNRCVDEVLAFYKAQMADIHEAARYVCLKLDIYWNPDIFDRVLNSAKMDSIMRSYIGAVNRYKYAGKTWDDTVREELLKAHEAAEAQAEKEPVAEAAPVTADTEEEAEEAPQVPEELVRFWGSGFTQQEYTDLENRYARWTNGQAEIDVGAETLYRQICILEMSIRRQTADGKAAESSIKQLNELIGSVNAKPVQKKTEETDTGFDTLPYGVGIKMYENVKPVNKRLEEFDDVDGIRRYITVWFFGHLCSMLHIKNSYCKLYEEEMAKLRVERPEYAEEEDDDMLYDIFGGGTA